MKSNIKKQSVSIVVPVLNEQDNIAELIYRIEQSLEGKYNYELIFVDDRSTDNTAKVIQEYVDDKKVKYFLKLGPAGKARALLEGFSYAKYDLITMIDCDLQYPPEAIPGMIEKMENKFDVVIAERKEAHAGRIRKTFSRGFNYVFARFLHNIKFDVQSGLKVFRKEIIERINIQPFPWTFDLEFLLAAKSAGYKITGYNIIFDKRKGGASKVNLIKTSFQIGLSALLLKLKSADVVPFHKDRKDALGPGFHYKGIEFIHFSDLNVADSAVKTLIGHQLGFILGFFAVILIGLLINWKFTVVTFVAVITVLYFIDLIFNFFLISRSFTKSPEITVDPSEFKSIKEWPKYTIFCPLYKEWIVVPQFVNAIEKLDYPKDKLEVQLLLEEDDTETIEHVKDFNLPDYIKIIVVPHSLPKTKPKACNYGLRVATGEYAVIYDAEDIPDRLQLKKAVVAFKKSPEYIACIQAKLNYYNKSQNLLTRLFTAEYSLWFDLVLTGLQSIGAPIPLGGTSNHFKVDKLREVKGWDSFNVTEDCDLGIRLVKNGYKTAIIDSLTMEEANSDFFNWINQRSRWIKGYIQTYLVHMRNPGDLLKNGFRAHFITFQLVVGGKILSLFINPFMWFLTALYFSLRAIVGPTIEQFFPGPVFYMAVFSLIFGNFLYVYYYMIGCAKREQYDLIKFIFLIPLYWLSMSYAAWKGLIQLISNPHYWPKTIHGLHLKKEAKETVPKVIVSAKEELGGTFLPRRKINEFINVIRAKKEYMAGLLFVGASLFANFLNFFFNAYLGRALDFENFAAISLVGSFSFLSTLISKGFSTTVTYKSGYFTGKNDSYSSYSFWKFMRKYALIFSAGIAVIWLLATPFLSSYFNADDIFLFILFALVFLVGFALAVDQAYMSGKLLFGLLALVTIFEPVVKNILAFVFVTFGYQDVAYAIVPITTLLTFFFGWIIVRRYTAKERRKVQEGAIKHVFPVKMFLVSMLLGLSSLAFLSFDVILAKHFLSPVDAGKYALVSLVGKMVYFLGGLASPFILPLVSRNEGASQDSKNVLTLSLIATSAITIAAFIAFGFFGYITIPFLYGEKGESILSYLTLFTAGIVFFTISRVYIAYYLAKNIYTLPLVSFLLTIVQFGLILFLHETVAEFVMVMFIIGALNLIAVVTLHYLIDYVKIIERNFKDFLGLFANLEDKKKLAEGKISILIFNWRDTKHKWAGGAEVYIHQLAKQWVQDGNHVTIFCGNSGKATYDDVIDGVKVYRRGGFYMVYLWAFVYYVFKFRGRYDVIIDSENGLPFFTPLYAKEKKFLLIHHVHQEVFRKSLIWPFSAFASFLEGTVMPLVYKNTEVITVSPSSRDEIMKHKLTKKTPGIVYNGVNHKLFKPGKKSAKPLAVYVGRLQFYKSLNIFINAAQKVLETIPEAEFIIAGEGEEKINLQKFVQKKGLADKITFTGFLSEQEKVKLLQKAWVFVNPSIMEGWAITTIEANACGTPAVASNVPGLKDSINDPKTGFLIPYGKSDQFAEKITLLMKNEKLRNKMSEEAYEWSQEFSWEESAELFYDFMKNDVHSLKTIKNITRRLATK